MTSYSDPVYFNYTGKERMYAIYSVETKQILIMHPILNIARKLQMILSGHCLVNFCVLSADMTLASPDCNQYRITEFINEIPCSNSDIDAIMSRSASEDLLTPECLTLGSLQHAYPVAVTIEHDDSLQPPPNQDLINYITYVVEKNWWFSKGFIIYEYAYLIESYMQSKDLFYNNKDTVDFLEYDMKATKEKLIDKDFGAEVYQACMKSNSIEELKAALLAIAKADGTIPWKI